MKEALLYEKLESADIICHLCAHNCLIHKGKRGMCAVRENRDGKLYSMVYGKLVSINIDPVEKKPLFHFLPGSRSLSIATAGCNFRCKHCQNYDISQFPGKQTSIPGRETTPEEVINTALRNKCESISYTYTEPTIFFEFAYDCAKLAHKKGLKNIFVSNGYTSPEAVKLIAPYLDAINIDLKGSDQFYREICGARINPVKETVKLMKELGIWVETTTLIIPGLNDSEKDLGDIAEFIRSVDPEIPWHISRFYPTYLLMDKPPTPVSKLIEAMDLGYKSGLKFVYIGNVPGEKGESTFCPSCNALLISRTGYIISKNRIKAGSCSECGCHIAGIWS